MYAPKILRKKKIEKDHIVKFFFDFLYVISNYVSLSLSLCNIERRVNKKIVYWTDHFCWLRPTLPAMSLFFLQKESSLQPFFFCRLRAGHGRAVKCHSVLRLYNDEVNMRERKERKKEAQRMSSLDEMGWASSKNVLKAVTHSPCADLISHFWFLDMLSFVWYSHFIAITIVDRRRSWSEIMSKSSCS